MEPRIGSGRLLRALASLAAGLGACLAAAPSAAIATAAPSGVAAPEDTSSFATLSGDAVAGSTLSCLPTAWDASSSTTIAWFRNGATLVGATSVDLRLTDSDVGQRLSCLATAGSSTEASAASAPVRARDLSGLGGSFVAQGAARLVTGASRLALGSATVRLSGTVTATAWAPYTIRSTSSVEVSIDGIPVGRGTRATVDPQTLTWFADGIHSLRVSSGSSFAQTTIVLAPAELALRASGGPGRSTLFRVSSRTGLPGVRFDLPAPMTITRRTGGQVTFRRAGARPQTFWLTGGLTRWHGIAVRLRAHRVEVTGLGAETGVIGVSLPVGDVTGRNGAAIRATATLRGTTAPTTSLTLLGWGR